MSAALLIHPGRTPLSQSNEWQTPRPLFDHASVLWGPYLIDVCAALWNHQCQLFFTKKRSALKRRWRGRCWMNPPYSRGSLHRFMGYARHQAFAGYADLVTCLVPSYTSERWWHDHVRKLPGVALHVDVVRHPGFASGFRVVGSGWAIEQLDLEGRLRFRHRNGVADSARHPSSLVTYYGPKLVTVDGQLRGEPSKAKHQPQLPFQNGHGLLPAGVWTHQEAQRWVF